MNLALLVIAIVMICCVLINKASSKIGMPMLLFFIALGMFFGSDGIVKIPFGNFQVAEQICSAALIIIMFDGGFGTKLSEARPVAGKALTLSSLGVFLTAGLTGLFCYLVLKFDFWEGMLIGSILGSTDAASVFSILRSKKLSMKYNTDSLLELESGSNDPFAYMLMVTVLSIMSGKSSPGSIVYTLFSQLVFGILGGVLIAAGAIWFMKQFKFATSGFDAAFVLAVAVLAYAAPALIGGNGYLSVYIVGIAMGNQKIKNKKTLVPFFDGLTGLMQMLIFFLLGLLSFPSQMPKILLPSLGIALFLTFVARPIAVSVILAPLKAKFRQQLVVSWAGLRGAASIVFAIMATVNEAFVSHDVFHIAFCVVLFSIALQGSLLPLIAKKTHMLDKKGNILKTFTDYSEESEVQFVNLNVGDSHPWVEKSVRDIDLPSDMLFATIFRGDETVIPNGDTVIESGDRIVMSVPGLSGFEDVKFEEITIGADNPWCGRQIAELNLPQEHLIIMIKREEHVIIPKGSMNVEKGDVLVINARES